MSEDNNERIKGNIQADDESIAIGSIDVGGDVSGNITIGHTIGYTADEVSALIQEISSTFQPKPFDGRCPYKGLDVFEEEDAELFFGREKLVDDLVERVKESRTVFITGPSGSGKSSLVRAGLIPALKLGGLKNSERWLYETVKPGRDPVEALALTFSRLKSPELGKYFRENVHQSSVLHECAESALSGRKDQRLVLFFDQFEEIFTQVAHEEARAAFLELLTHAATVEDGRVVILFAMRSDFVSNCATYPELNALLNEEFVQIGAIGPDELVSAIAQPALRVGLRIDPDLIAQIINDMQGEPGALPLMQFALKDLFEAEQAKGGVIVLTREAYLQRGGIQKSLERHADASFAKLEKNEQELARSIFGGLIEIGHGTQDTRRMAFLDELIPASASAREIENIVRKLADARLITTDELAGRDMVTISHEKLIDAWPWLKKLVNENREVIALQNQIATDAKGWDDKKRDSSYLYTGARLASAREQLEKKKIALSNLARAYILAGVSQQKRGQRFRFGVIITVISSLVIAVIIYSNQSNENRDLARKTFELLTTAEAANTKTAEFLKIAQANRVFAELNRASGEEQLNFTKAGELTNLAITIGDEQPTVSMLLALEAYSLYDSPQTRSILISYLSDDIYDEPLLENRIETDDTLLTVSSDGKIFITWDGVNLIFSEIDTGQPVGIPITVDSKDIVAAAFSPDGKILATVNSNEISVLSVETGATIGQFPNVSKSWVKGIVFSPDGRLLASVDDNNSVALWDIKAHKPLGESFISDLAHVHSYAETMVFNSDSDLLAFNNGLVLNIDSQQLTKGQLSSLGNFIEGVSVDFSPDGETIAIGGGSTRGSTITFLNITTNQILGQLLSNDEVMAVAFSPDGKILASGSPNELNLWDVARLEPIIQPMYDVGGYVENLIFSPDEKLISWSFQNIISIWDLNPDSLYQKVCIRAGRNFTHAEWAQYFQGEEYRKTCERWPLE